MKLRASALVLLLIVSGVSCSRNPDVVKKKYLQNGNRYFEKGKYKEAFIMYRNALKKDPMYSEAYYRLGLTEMRMGRLQEAARDLRRAVDTNRDNIDAKVQLGELYLVGYLLNPRRPDNLAEEIDRIQKQLLERDAKSVRGLRLRGYLLMLRDKNYKEAVDVFQRAGEISAMQPDIVLPLAQSLVSDGRLPEAEKIGRALIERQKTFGPMYDLLYAEYMKANRPQDAENILKLKVANNPKHADPLLQLAQHYFGLQRRADMQSTLDKLTSNTKDFPDAHLRAGMFYFVTRDFDSALRQFQEGSRQDTRRKAEYQKRMAEVMTAQGHRQEAMQVLEAVLKENSKDDQAQAMRAALLIETGNPQQVQQAVDNLQAAVSQTPQNAVLRFNLGRALVARRQLEQARIQFQEAVKLQPDFMPARLALGQLLLAKADFSGALQAADEALKFDPQNLAVKLIRTTSLAALGKRDQARAELTEAVKENPGSREAIIQLALLDVAEKRFKDAEEIFSRLHQSAPADLRGLVGLVETYTVQGKYDQALQLLKTELAKDPNRNEVRLAFGNVAFLARQYDTALQQYQVLLQAAPQSAGDLYIRIGHAYTKKGDANAAIQAFEKARQLRPSDTEPYLRLAMLLDGSGQAPKARPLYEQILKLQPDNAIALNNLAFMIAETGGDLDQAMTLAQRAKQKWPADPNIADTLGWIYIKKNLSEKAVEIFRDLVAKQPEAATFRYHLGMALYQRGDKVEARKALLGALQKNPSKEEAAKIKELIGKLG